MAGITKKNDHDQKTNTHVLKGSSGWLANANAKTIQTTRLAVRDIENAIAANLNLKSRAQARKS